MFRVLSCIVTEHDHKLVLLAALVCAATSFTAFHAYACATREKGPQRLAWVFVTAMCTAAGIWATHFVGILAYDPGPPVSYDAVLTIASLLVAAVLTLAGFAIASRGSRWLVAAGGAVLGAGIAVMHFTGMQALVVPGTLEWDRTLVVASILIGIGLAAAALLAWHRLERRKAVWMAPTLLALAICGMHFTAMGAATVVPDPTIAVPASSVDDATLAVAITGVTTLVMLALLAMTLITNEGKRDSLARNQELVDATLEGLVVANDGVIVNVNRRVLELTRKPTGDLLGRRVIGELVKVAEGTVQSSGKTMDGLLMTDTERAVPVEVVCRPLTESTRANEVYAIRDVTERQNAEAELRHQYSMLQQREEELRAQSLRLEEQRTNLHLALANMSQGLAMFDGQERLVLANDRYAEIYGLEPRHLQPGTTLRELIEYRISKGLYPGMTAADVLKTTRERVARKRTNHLISRPGDGRTLAVSIDPRSDGGWVVTLQDISEREQLNARLVAQNALLQQREEELAAQNTRFDAAIGNMSQGMCLFDAQHRIVFANKRYAELYRLTPDQVKPGTTIRQIFEARAVERGYGDGHRDREEYVRQGIERFNRCTTEVIELTDGRFISVIRRRMPGGGLLSTHEDITEREKLNAQLARKNELLMQREQELAARNEQLDAALNNMLQGLAMYDSQYRIVMCNRRYAEMYGLPPKLARAGTSLRSIVEHRIATGEYPGQSVDDVVRGLLERIAGQKVDHYVTQLSDGRHIAVSVQPMVGGGTVTTHHDITDQRRSEAKIAHMALHDTLTGLPNRVLLNERLEDAVRRVKRGEIVAAHLLDLDNFKAVNDTLGHPAGDKLLKLVADRLRSVVRETDTIARMGGDEFAIVQTAIAQPADSTALAHRIIDSISAPYVVEGHQVVIGTSVGIAVGPSDGTTPDQLVRNADLALYRAKGDGRGTYRFFEREMDAQMQVRRAMENDLRKALAAGEFELYYQPVVNLASDEISGFEALVRWRHPERGLVPPGSFIPLAEEMGLIVSLGEWAIREACGMAVKWPDDLKIAVNLSPAQFRGPGGLVHVVVSALAATGLAAERLELEITENTLLQDSEANLTTLYQLRALGVRIAMDDFGTGYSSLSYLQSFPFDKLKIDRSFVKDIADGVGSLNIVRAVTAMASGLGMTTTAEGVETIEQLDAVRAEGCTEMQGYIYSEPIPAGEVDRFLREQRGAGAFQRDRVRRPRKAAGAA